MREFRVYDTLSRELRTFRPITPPRVGLFVCGLTPYAEAHVGHGRVAVVFDVVARALTAWGYRPLYVQNVTNVDDRLIERAAAEGTDPLALAERHMAGWLQAMEELGVRSVNYYPRATDYIPEIIAQVAALVDRGFAYVARDGSVYFDVGRFPDYGRLSGQRVEALRPGARLEVDPRKRAPEDFVLWKAAVPGEPSWPSPWGPGRPGWHIEDTAITGRLLGPRYDLHGGGVDLKFPHHEAEIAQAEGASGERPFVNYWMHVGLVEMGGTKMSKSIGNVYPLRQALDEYGPWVVRFYYLNAHYRSPLGFQGSETLDESREAYRRLAAPREAIRRARARDAGSRERDLPAGVAAGAEALVDRLDAHLADDFHTREVIAELFGWGRTVTELLASPSGASLSDDALDTLERPYEWAQRMLGLWPETPPVLVGEADASAVIEAAIAARARARARGDYAEADRIRHDLERAGITLEDRGNETTWQSNREDAGRRP